jgi:sialidase-1
VDPKAVGHRIEADDDAYLQALASLMPKERCTMAGSQSNPLAKNVWQSGRDGYHTYRIPALAVTTKGTLLAFCEGRRDSSSDTGRIDLLVKRSTDNGKSWSAQQTIWHDADNTCGNPCPVVDRETGTIWLLMTWNRGHDREAQIVDQKSTDTRRVFVTFSMDDGLTWAVPEEITAAVKKANWTWYATGPGGGMQIEKGAYAGRLVIPCDHIEAETKHYYSHVIYSDDHGRTWKLGGRSPRQQVNECQVVELSGGRLMLNMRNYDRAHKQRQVAYSDDGGATWTHQHFDATLIEPICQASIRRYSWPGTATQNVILFSNPANEHARVNMTVRASFDDGLTWPLQEVLYAGPSGYSDLAVCHNGTVACLYECGEVDYFETIELAHLDIDDLDM